jgi:hypothetical protein
MQCPGSACLLCLSMSILQSLWKHPILSWTRMLLALSSLFYFKIIIFLFYKNGLPYTVGQTQLRSSSTVVLCSTHNLKIEGLNPATGIGKRKWRKIKKRRSDISRLTILKCRLWVRLTCRKDASANRQLFLKRIGQNFFSSPFSPSQCQWQDSDTRS